MNIVTTGIDSGTYAATRAAGDPRRTPVAASRSETLLPGGYSGGSQFAQNFGAFLAAKRIIDASVVDRATRAAQAARERFDHVLVKLGLVAEPDLLVALSEYLAIPTAASVPLPREPLLPGLIEAEFVRRSRIMPLAIDAAGLTVGVTDPFHDEPVRALAFLTDRAVNIALFAPAEFDKAYDALYGASPAGAREDPAEVEANELDVQRLRDIANEAPIIRLVNQIIAAAVEAGASDIHIEPGVDTVLVRHRLDGVLRTAQTFGTALRAAVTSRVKIMAKLDIAERRLPQDGRIKVAVRGTDIDFRVSTIPTVFGESVVMRILDRSRVELDFHKLGFAAPDIVAMEGLLGQPDGIILVTGPTGSGKTTTLYTALRGLNTTENKVFTVEDPIEYQLGGINQIQVHPAIGLTFPHALRAILRQDPDIIMIGEIRDLETARIAIQSSLTGHLVLSTLHTNSAAATITRMIDMGVENYLLASTVKGILAQRLVRRLCRTCSRPHDGAGHWAAQLTKMVPHLEAIGPCDIRQPVGCPACNETGFAGRTTVAEILRISPDIQGLILSLASDTRIEAAAREAGMTTMYASGAGKVWRGETTIEDVLRATRAA